MAVASPTSLWMAKIACKRLCVRWGHGRRWPRLVQHARSHDSIKSPVVFKDAESEVEPFALFCGEDDRFGTHLESSAQRWEVYLCGIGGSEYVDADELRAGKYPPGEVPSPKRVEAATKSFSMTAAGRPRTRAGACVLAHLMPCHTWARCRASRTRT